MIRILLEPHINSKLQTYVAIYHLYCNLDFQNKVYTYNYDEISFILNNL